MRKSCFRWKARPGGAAGLRQPPGPPPILPPPESARKTQLRQKLRGLGSPQIARALKDMAAEKKIHQVVAAVEVLAEDRSSRLDQSHFTIAINECGKVSQWTEALHLLNLMEQESLPPDTWLLGGVEGVCWSLSFDEILNEGYIICVYFLLDPFRVSKQFKVHRRTSSATMPQSVR